MKLLKSSIYFDQWSSCNFQPSRSAAVLRTEYTEEKQILTGEIVAIAISFDLLSPCVFLCYLRAISPAADVRNYI